MGELPGREKPPQSCLQSLSTPTGSKRGGEEEPIKKPPKKNKKREINKHHPAWLHLPLIYGPAEKPGCPQLLGSQLLFAVIPWPLLFTWHPLASQPGSGGSGGSVWAGIVGSGIVGCLPGSGVILQGAGVAAGGRMWVAWPQSSKEGERALRWSASKANQKIKFCPEPLAMWLYLHRAQKLGRRRFPSEPS